MASLRRTSPSENKNESLYHLADHDLLKSNGSENDQVITAHIQGRRKIDVANDRVITAHIQRRRMIDVANERVITTQNKKTQGCCHWTKKTGSKQPYIR